MVYIWCLTLWLPAISPLQFSRTQGSQYNLPFTTSLLTPHTPSLIPPTPEKPLTVFTVTVTVLSCHCQDYMFCSQTMPTYIYVFGVGGDLTENVYIHYWEAELILTSNFIVYISYIIEVIESWVAKTSGSTLGGKL